MKKISLILFTLAALATSCRQKVNPSSDGESISIAVAPAVTKAAISDGGSGGASFSWSAGDEIGVVAGGQLLRFSFKSRKSDGTASFEGTLPQGALLENGAPVAYPYNPADFAGGAFKLVFPSEYESAGASDFSHRWSGTLSAQTDGSFRSVLEHSGAILRISYTGVPADVDAVRLTADKNICDSGRSITIRTSWHSDAMDFYFPVPEGEYGKFEVALLKGGSTIEGSAKTLDNTAMRLSHGSIYRTPAINMAAPSQGGGVLVACFSFTGNTWTVAQTLSELSGAELYRITPSVAYGDDNNNYYDSSTRAYQEQYGPATARPEIQATLGGNGYDTLLLGFPIWYGKAPRVVFTFLDTYDFSGKTVVPFITSGSTGISSAASELRSAYPGINWKTGERLNGRSSAALEEWLGSLGINKQTTSDMTVTVNGKSFGATLADNSTARAFAELLPMTLDMEELNGNEKYCYLSGSLPSAPANPGRIEEGDIMLYGNSCVVIFYESFNTSYSYTRIGKITDPSGLKAALGSGNPSVSFGR